MRLLARIALLCCAILASEAALSQESKPERPLILTVRQFECLRRQADTLKIGLKGASVDFGTCPPIVEDGYYPVTPSQTKRYFMPADMDCLVRARRAHSGIAFVRPGLQFSALVDICVDGPSGAIYAA